MRLPEFIKRDWSRKLVAVFMAGIIWVTVHQQLQVTSTLRDVTVRVTTSPDLIMLEQERLRVRVTVRGSRRRVPNITSADIRVEAHVVEINDRRHSIELRSRNVVLPAGISLVEIEPSTIDVMIDHLKDAERPIAYKFEGELARQFGRNVRIHPNNANISGPKHLIDQIDEIETEPIRLSAETPRDRELKKEVALVPPPQVTVNPLAVTVVVEFYRRLETKEFENLNVHVLHAIGSPVEVTALDPPDAKIKVLIEGPTSTLDVLLRSSIQPYIDLSVVHSADQVRLPIEVEFPEAKDCRVLEVTPRFIKANVRIKEKAPLP
jgi:YbbR domain-containing protein